MIGDHHHHRIGVSRNRRLGQPLHHPVQRLQVRIRLRAERPMRVLRIVQRTQVQRHEPRLQPPQNLHRIARLRLVAANRSFVAHHVLARLRLQLLQQRRRPRDSRNQQPVFGIRRPRPARRIGAPPVLRNQPIHIRRPRAHRPSHARRPQPALARRRPQRRNPYQRCIPIPRARVMLQRIEFQVVINPMLRRPNPRNQRGVARISHRRPNPHHPLGIRSLAQQRAQIRNLHPMRIGLRNVFRLQPVNGNHQHRRRMTHLHQRRRQQYSRHPPHKNPTRNSLHKNRSWANLFLSTSSL